MGDTNNWDYDIRRIEIAWEMAQKLKHLSIENYAKALQEAWEAVDKTFPKINRAGF